MAINDHTAHSIAPRITLHTNHNCPFAQRAHITLDELELAYDEVLIDLDIPRPQWYLDINPCGLVPTIKYFVPGVLDEVIITESAVVAQFLCNSHPSHLLPTSNASPSAAPTRARIAFFCDTWSTKVSPSQLAIMRAESAEAKETAMKESMAVMEKEIEPLLADVNPFFGGSKKLMSVEVFTAPFVQRLLALAEDGDMVPKALLEAVKKLPNFGRWTKAIFDNRNATSVFAKELFFEASRESMKRMRGAKKLSGGG